MSQSLQLTSSGNLAKMGEADAALLEQVLAQGDLGKLSSKQRLAYYAEVCRVVGVAPETRPFEFVTLQGKTVLYARKDCTDQLRTRRRVSTRIVEKSVMEGVYIVVCEASLPDGRVDSSTGAVPIASLKGEALANAIMKAETKAKRRATLSLCGLGVWTKQRLSLSRAWSAISKRSGHPTTI